MASFYQRIALLLLAVWCVAHGVEALDDMYCGEETCYEVLGVDTSATTRQIRSAYRKLSLKWHPDKNPAPGAKAKFVTLATAMEVLSDADQRETYDFYLAHPEARFYNRAQYYRYAATRTDWRIVVGCIVAAVTAAQLGLQFQRYNVAMQNYRRDPGLLRKARELAAEWEAEGKYADSGGARKGGKRKASKRADKERQRRLQAEALDEVMAGVEIRGGYHKPGMYDIFPIWLVWKSWRLMAWTAWALRWCWRRRISKAPLDENERAYLTRRALRVPEYMWEEKEDEERKELLKQELWKPGNMEKYTSEQMRSKMTDAQWRRVVRYRRKMKQ